MRLLTDVINKISTESSNTKAEVSAIINRELTEILDQMMLKTEDVSAAVISSLDGIAWAERIDKGFDQHRFAAMSSALLALSDNLCQEASTGETQNVLIEGANGKIFVMHAGSSLVLTVFVRPGANLGITLAYARQATNAIAALTV
jgi:predicted regulator of Ras-like GTPase activity (Roadblock/LC7/MglB family)